MNYSCCTCSAKFLFLFSYGCLAHCYYQMDMYITQKLTYLKCVLYNTIQPESGSMLSRNNPFKMLLVTHQWAVGMFPGNMFCSTSFVNVLQRNGMLYGLGILSRCSAVISSITRWSITNYYKSILINK